MRNIIYKILRTFLILNIVFFIGGCKDSDDKGPVGSGNLELSFLPVNSNGKLAETEEPTSLVFSISTDNEEIIFDTKQIDLISFGDGYLTEPIPMETGNYVLLKFLVLNASDEVIYASPLEGSELDYLVDQPLPINFQISEDEITTLSPEVISAVSEPSEAFGYTVFGLNIVETFSFLVTALTFDEVDQDYDFVSADLSVSIEGDIIHSSDLLPGLNTVKLRDEESNNYTLTISKEGFENFESTFSSQELQLFFDSADYGPLVVILNTTPDQNTISLKPGSEVGKDAQVWSYDPDGTLDRGTNRQDIVAYEWTKDGSPTTKYGLIDFDLSMLEGLQIVEAKLILYHDPTSVDLIHSQLSGSNEMIIQRITSTWEEPVSWGSKPATTTANEILVPASTSDDQDYEIDVTGLVQDMVDDPDNSFGFQFKIATEQYYRSVGFASSDHPQAELHPELIITYQ